MSGTTLSALAPLLHHPCMCAFHIFYSMSVDDMMRSPCSDEKGLTVAGLVLCSCCMGNLGCAPEPWAEAAPSSTSQDLSIRGAL